MALMKRVERFHSVRDTVVTCVGIFPVQYLGGGKMGKKQRAGNVCTELIGTLHSSRSKGQCMGVLLCEQDRTQTASLRACFSLPTEETMHLCWRKSSSGAVALPLLAGFSKASNPCREIRKLLMPPYSATKAYNQGDS